MKRRTTKNSQNQDHTVLKEARSISASLAAQDSWKKDGLTTDDAYGAIARLCDLYPRALIRHIYTEGKYGCPERDKVMRKLLEETLMKGSAAKGSTRHKSQMNSADKRLALDLLFHDNLSPRDADRAFSPQANDCLTRARRLAELSANTLDVERRFLDQLFPDQSPYAQDQNDATIPRLGLRDLVYVEGATRHTKEAHEQITACHKHLHDVRVLNLPRLKT